MSATVLALVLLSAVLHATWNLWAKQIGVEVARVPLIWALTAISTVAYAPLVAGSLALHPWRPTPVALVAMGGSAVLHVGYFLLLLRGYRRGDLSVVYPVARGTGPLLAAAGAVLWLGERATPLSVAGALLVAAGIATLSFGRGARAAAPRAGLGDGLLVGLTIGVYTLWDGNAVRGLGVPPLAFYWGGELTRTALLGLPAWRRRGEVAALWRGHRARVLAIALLSPLAYLLVLFALQRAPVSHVAPARELSILIGAGIGSRVLGEGEGARRLLAALAFAAGVAALALARG